MIEHSRYWKRFCEKATCTSLLMVLLVSSLPCVVLGETGRSGYTPSEFRPWLGFQTGVRLGVSDLSGQPSRAFEDATSFEFILGARIWRLSVEGFWQPTGASPTREFIRNSGYPKGFFGYLDHSAMGLLCGLHVYDNYGVRIAPLIGLRWASVTEDWFFLHPNWDLNSKSSAGLMGGIRLEFRLGKHGDSIDDFVYLNWFYFQIVVADLKYDNPEYGSGRMVGLTLGYTFEGMRGE